MFGYIVGLIALALSSPTVASVDRILLRKICHRAQESDC